LHDDYHFDVIDFFDVIYVHFIYVLNYYNN